MAEGVGARRPPTVPEGWRTALGRFAWALYDWANSPFSTLILTFVFPAYFQRTVVANPVQAQQVWGYAIAASGLLVAVLSPGLGAVADAGGRRKPWILTLTVVCAGGSALLWFVAPAPRFAVLAVACVIVANVALELSIVVCNAMLPDLARPERLGRLSGWAWGAGYAGGLAALMLALTVFVAPDTPPFGLDRGSAEQIRIIGPFVAGWLLLFSAPLFLFTRDRPSLRASLRAALTNGLTATGKVVGELRSRPNVLRFLLAHMLYADGLVTLFAFGGLYASGVFQLSLEEVVRFGIALNIAAGIGAFSFAWVDDWLGSKRTVLLALVGIVGFSALAVTAEGVAWLWISGIGIGIFVGPAQAASRSLMARLAPSDRRAEYFGLYALSGKATSFLGPAVVALVTEVFDSQRAGLASILPFFLIGLLVLFQVKDPGSEMGSKR